MLPDLACLGRIDTRFTRSTADVDACGPAARDPRAAADPSNGSTSIRSA